MRSSIKPPLRRMASLIERHAEYIDPLELPPWERSAGPNRLWTAGDPPRAAQQCNTLRHGPPTPSSGGQRSGTQGQKLLA
ncbi:hypothetical protein CH063_12583 [Colletotrichum higginsianum]|uniref:Uncharacterized protein n=1 Tax=Colletotrichum higginsianum (strain IMI 349063) TaxID=759273 RepID=H1VQY6_COLHI|nr:hypothetical protein CH063_12583 [Colletotrichum higginsianum]